MKVLQIVGYTDGGIGAHVKTLAKDLRHIGENVLVLAPENVINNFGFQNCIDISPNIACSIKGMKKFINTAKILRKCISDSDIVHVHGNQMAFFSLLFCKKRDRRKIIVTLHNKIILSGYKQFLSVFLRKYVARNAEVVSAVSSDLLEEARVDGAKHTFIAPIFAPKVECLLKEKRLSFQNRHSNFLKLINDLPEDKRKFFDINKPLVLSVCRIAAQKSIENVVRIANSGIDANFVVVGSGVKSLLERLKAEDVNKKVYFAGKSNDIPTWLNAANIMLLTSKWEGCPLVLQEAMANGLPIVSTFVGGIGDLVYDDENDLKAGMLSEVDDWQNMASHVQLLLNDETLWNKFSKDAKQIAKMLLTNSEIAVFWQKNYLELV